MSNGNSHSNTQYLPPVPPPQHTLLALLAALLPRLGAGDRLTVQAAIQVVAAAQPATYPP